MAEPIIPLTLFLNPTVSLLLIVSLMSGAVAARLRLRDRGLLREGMYADVVVFDDATILDLSTPAKPHVLSRGVEQVFVNGVQVVNDGKHTGATPGRVLRRREALAPS